jgi:hypothetical protein
LQGKQGEEGKKGDTSYEAVAVAVAALAISLFAIWKTKRPKEQ